MKRRIAIGITLTAAAFMFGFLTACDQNPHSERRALFEERYPECYWGGGKAWECALVQEIRRRNDLLEAGKDEVHKP